MSAPPGPPNSSSPALPTGTLAEADGAAASPDRNKCPAKGTVEGVSADPAATEQPPATSAAADAATADAEGAEGEATPPDGAVGPQRRNRWADESDDLDSPAFDPMTAAAAPPPLSLEARADFLPPPAPMEDRGLRDLLVSELDGRMTEREIMQLFQGVKKVRIRKGESGRRTASLSAIVSFVSHEAVCAALAMNGRPYPRRGGGGLGGLHRGDRHKGGTGILRVQVPPRDNLDMCFSKFRTGGLGGGQSGAAAASDGHRVGGADGGGALSSGGGAAAASSSPARGGSWGSGRASGAELKWRKHLKSPEGAASTAAGAAETAAASTKEQHQRQNHEATSNNTSGGGSASPAVALVAPKDLLKEQLKPQGLKLNPAIFGEAKPRDEALLPQKQRDTREGLSRQGFPSNIVSVLQQGMLAPPPPPSPQQHKQQQQPHLQKQQPSQPPEQQQRWRSGLLPQQQQHQQHQQQQSSSDRQRRRQDPLCGVRPRDDTPLMSAPKQQQLLQERNSPMTTSQQGPVHADQGANAATAEAGAAAGHAEARDGSSSLTEKPANAAVSRRADSWGNWSRGEGTQEDTANPSRRGWRVGPPSSSNSTSSSSSTVRPGEALTAAAAKENGSAGETRQRGGPKVADNISAPSASLANGRAEQQLQQQQEHPQQHKQNQSGEASERPVAPFDTLAGGAGSDRAANQQQNEEQQQLEHHQTAQRKTKRGLAWQSKGDAPQEPSVLAQDPCGSREGPPLACEPTGAPQSPSRVVRQQQHQQGIGQGMGGAREDRRGHRGDKRLGGGQGGPGLQGRGGGGSVFRWGPAGAPLEASASATQRPIASEDRRVAAERFGAEFSTISHSSSNSSSNTFTRMQSTELGTPTDSQRSPTPVAGRGVSARERGARWQRGPGVLRGKRDDNTETVGHQKHWRHHGAEGSPKSNTLRAAPEEEGAPSCLSTSSRETTAASALAAGEGKAKVTSQQQPQQQQEQQQQDPSKMGLANKSSSSQQEV
ncbi:hypothetical protein ACSSS7_004300 [Eimeria intestinalis]